MNPLATPASPQEKKRRLALMVGIGALAVLFVMSRRGSSSSASQSATGAYTATDLQNAADQAATQQAQADQSGMAGTGYGFGAGADPSMFGSGSTAAPPDESSTIATLAGLVTALATNGQKTNTASKTSQASKDKDKDRDKETSRDKSREHNQHHKKTTAKNHGGATKHHGGTKRHTHK